MAVTFLEEAPKTKGVTFLDEEPEPLSAGISGSDQTPPLETPTLSPNDPRFPEVAQAVGTGIQTAQAIARPFQVDLSAAVPGEERGRQLKAVEIERTLAQDAVHQLSGVHPASVEERVAAAQELSGLMRKERGLRAIQQQLHAESPEGQREALSAYMAPLYERFHGSAEGGAPGLAATGFAKVAEGALGMSAAAGEALGMGEAAQQMRADMAGFERTAAQTKGHAADVVRGLAGLVPLVAGLPEGKAGVVQATVRAAADTYSHTYDRTGDRDAAYDAAIQTAPEMAAFLLSGAAAAKGVGAMLPKDARAVTAGLANFAGAEVANVGVSNVLSALHDQDYGLSNFSADTLFALYHGIGGYEGRVTELERQRAAEKLKSYGWSEEQINAPYDGPAQTPAFEIIKPTEERQNAQQVITTDEGRTGSGSESNPEGKNQMVVGADQQSGAPKELPPESSRPAPSEGVVGIVPAIKVGDQIVRGEPGDTHKDVLNRFIDANPDSAADALMDFDTKSNPNFFAGANGEPISREQLQERFGVKDSQGLRDLQQTEPRRNLGPGAANIEEPLGVGKPIAAYNAAVDEQRQARGLPPLMSEAARADADTWAKVEQRIEDDPALPDKIVSDLNAGRKKEMSDEDQGVLLWQRIDLGNKLADEYARIADENLSPDDRADAESAAAHYEQKLAENDTANRKAGTVLGRGLRSRRFQVNDDFTLTTLMGKARAAKGAPLTPEERTKIQQQAEGIAATQKAFEDRTAKLEDEAAGADVDTAIRAIETEARKNPDFTPEVRSLADRIVARLDKAAESALKRLRAKLGQANVGADPTILADAIIYGSAKIGKGLTEFVRWGAAMVKDLGEGIKPYLEDIWKGANAEIDANVERAVPDKTKRAKVKAAVTKEGAAEAVAAIGENMKERAKGGEKLKDMRGDIQKLVESLVRSGVKGRDAVIDAVHEVLKGADPSITRRQAMDAISGYGDFKPLNRDAIKAEVRDLRGQMQQVAKIEDILGKKPLQKTGVERRTPSDEERSLIKQVNELAKQHGVVVTDPARQLKTALGAIETRLTNRIRDLKSEIAAGARTIKTKTPAPTNEKIEALRKELTTLEAEHEKVFGKRQMTPEQKLNAAVASAKRAEEAERARLEKAKRGIFERPIKSVAMRSAELDAIKARTEAARQERKALETAANPKRTKEEIALQSIKSRLAKRNAELTERIAKGDFAKRPRKPVDISKDKEAVRLRAENERMKRDFEKARFEDEMRKRKTLQKGIDAIKETLAASRSLITSADVSAPLRQGGFLLIGDLPFHPVRVAKQLGTMFHQLVSEKGFERAQAAIGLRPNADLYQQSKLYFSDLNSKLSAREENMRSNLVEQIPIVGRIVRASNRAYSGFLNRQRADAFDAMIEARGGKDKVTPEGAKLIANAVNTLTGRGSIGAKNEAAANLLARYMFSPRFLASRFQTVLGKPILGAMGEGASAKDRAVIARQYVKFAVGLSALYGLAKLVGAKVEKDPRSSDFGKLRFGQTRVDPLAGLAQVTTLMARMRNIKTIGGEIKPSNFDTVANFGRGKLAPIPGAFIDLTYGQGKNIVGEKVTPLSAVRNLTLPISYQDVGKIYKEQGPLKGTVFNILNLLGAGVQSYRK